MTVPPEENQIYPIYPGVNYDFEFPPLIRQAIADSVEVQAAIEANNGGGVLAEANTYTDNKDTTNRNDWSAADTTKLAEAKTYADTKDTTNRTDWAAADTTKLAEAKTYADTKDTTNRTDWATADTAKLVEAKAYADTKDATRIPFRVTNTGDLDTMTVTEDVLFSGLSSVTNHPDTVLGMVMVRNAGGNILQKWMSVLRAGTVSWSRYKAGAAAWTAWEAASPRGGNITNSTWDFNNLRVPFVHSVSTASALNMPTAKVGTLWVVPSTGFVRQIFETWEENSEVYTRRATSTSAWGAWIRKPSWADWNTLDDRLTDLEGGTGGVASHYAEPTRAALATSTLVESSKNSTDIMSSLSLDRSRGWNMGGNSVRETRDDGLTWATLSGSSAALTNTNVEFVRQMGNGELVVGANFISESRRGVIISSGYPAGGTITWTRVLTTPNPMVKFTAAWSVYVHDHMVFLAEYGPKTGTTWDGNAVAADQNARYVYMSLDYGKTFTTIFDLNTYLVSAHAHVNTDWQHLHGIAWDKYWDRIWITWGDNNGGAGSNGIAYSDDLGTTWTTAHYHKGASSPFQIVGIQPMPKCILLFGDLSPDVLRIDRTDGKFAGTYTPNTAFDSTANGRHLCQGYWRAERPGDDAPTLATFCAEMEVAPSFSVATLDGYNFVEIWRDAVNNPVGMGARAIVGPTLRGNVIMNIDDLKVGGKRTEVKGRAPGY